MDFILKWAVRLGEPPSVQFYYIALKLAIDFF